MKNNPKYRVLIVDDRDDNRYVVKVLLEEEFGNLECIEASSGDEALEIAKKSKIDLILLDVQMPKMSGFEVARELQKFETELYIPIVFLTAVFTTDEFEQEGLNLGAIDYLKKPIENRELINKVRLYLKIFEQQLALQEFNLELQKKVEIGIEQNRLNEEMMLQQSRHAQMGEMLAMIAHQWRQPLMEISTTIAKLQMQTELNKLQVNEMPTILETMDSTVQFLSHTLDDFRDFFKPRTASAEADINAILDKAIEFMASLLGFHKIIVKKEYNFKTKPHIYGNELLQVIINLIKNSIEAYVQNGIVDGVITIKGKESPEVFKIVVEDEAGGISSEIKTRVFEPYFTTKDELSGTGLGLYMSKTIVEKHLHGTLRLKNTKKGLEAIVKI